MSSSSGPGTDPPQSSAVSRTNKALTGRAAFSAQCKQSDYRRSDFDSVKEGIEEVRTRPEAEGTEGGQEKPAADDTDGICEFDSNPANEDDGLWRLDEAIDWAAPHIVLAGVAWLLFRVRDMAAEFE